MNNFQHRRIFITDDDPFWSASLCQMLRSLGYNNIIMYASGDECVNHLHLNPALVFLDYKMKDMDGLEVLKNIKSYYPGIEVVFCTAHPELRVAIEAMKNGSSDYLLKSNAGKKEIAAIILELNEKQMIPDDRIYP